MYVVSIVLYYHEKPIAGMYSTDFNATGGIQLEQHAAAEGSGDFVESRSQQLNELGLDHRVVYVEVGPYDGMLTWGDPDLAGTRLHNLSWSDGEYDYTLLADMPAEDILTLGRSLVCEG